MPTTIAKLGKSCTINNASGMSARRMTEEMRRKHCCTTYLRLVVENLSLVVECLSLV